MLSDDVWPSMAAAFESATGGLVERMLVALEAAQAAGGDIRGEQSAAILVVSGSSTGRPWNDRLVDLRVEDHPEPLVELRRLLDVKQAYGHMNAGDLAIEEGDVEAALREYGAAEAMFPHHVEMKFWHAVSLVNLARVDASLPLFEEMFAADANWAMLVPRLVGVGLLDADQATLDRIATVAP